MLRLAVVLFLATLVGCQTNSIESHPEYDKIQEEVARVVEAVRASTGNSLVPNLQRLVAYDVFAVGQASDLASDPNPRLRCNAVWVLSQIQDTNYPEVQRDIEDVLWDALEDGDRLVRYEAAAGLLSRSHWETIPVLLEGLTDEDPVVRINCHQALQEVTGEEFGYLADGDIKTRDLAVARWQDWYDSWEENG